MVLDSAPGFGSIQGDISNGYNEIEHEGVLTAIRKEDALNNTLSFSHTLLEPVAYVGMGNGSRLLNAPFISRESVQQGAVESGCFFCNQSRLGLQKVVSTHAPSRMWCHGHR